MELDWRISILQNCFAVKVKTALANSDIMRAVKGAHSRPLWFYADMTRLGNLSESLSLLQIASSVKSA